MAGAIVHHHGDGHFTHLAAIGPGGSGGCFFEN
jgi:hypothetical protein